MYSAPPIPAISSLTTAVIINLPFNSTPASFSALAAKISAATHDLSSAAPLT